MRFFIALEIPNESKIELKDVQNDIKEIIPDIKLTDPEKFHLTIAFIGEQHNNLKEDLIKVLTTASSNIPPFTVNPAYIDGFPNLHHAHIIWSGVKGDIGKLMIIRERIKDSLTYMKIVSDERRYIPHIALGKINNFNLNQSQEILLQQVMLHAFTPIHISSIKLFESIPGDGLHKHNTLAEIILTG